jgi:hypothetical protein
MPRQELQSISLRSAHADISQHVVVVPTGDNPVLTSLLGRRAWAADAVGEKRMDEVQRIDRLQT